MLPFVLVATASCAQAEPVGSAPPGEPPIEALPKETPPSATTELGAVALPDAKGCLERCSAQRPEAECRAECADQCLAHCKNERPSSANWASACEKDCQSQHDAANAVRSR